MIFSISLVLLVANLCFAWRSRGCKRCSHRKLKCYKTSLQVVVQPLNYNFPPLERHIRCTSSSGSGGAGLPLPLIFEAPDYILRPKLCIFQADQSWPPPLGQILDPLLTSYDKAKIYTLSDIGLF